MLRPQAVHHEMIRPGAALLLRGTLGRSFLRGFTEGRRPGQRQNIEVEFAGLAALSLFLSLPVLAILRQSCDVDGGKAYESRKGCDRSGPKNQTVSG
jgi:hypothetical protein